MSKRSYTFLNLDPDANRSKKSQIRADPDPNTALLDSLHILFLRCTGSRASSQYMAGQYGMVQQQGRGTTPPSHYGTTPPSQYGMARPTQRPPSPPQNVPLMQNYGR
jgi:hypothetical protein